MMLRRLLTSKNLFVTTFTNKPIIVLQVPLRCMGYYKSNLEEPKENYTEVEKSYAEWKFVEKLIPPVHVPQPPTDHRKTYPSGWRPQNPNLDLPYHIQRTKNHMLPIYFDSDIRSQVQSTLIRRVEGNIWQLEKDVGRYIKKKYPHKAVATMCHEPRRYVKVRGDYVDDVIEWATDIGF